MGDSHREIVAGEGQSGKIEPEISHVVTIVHLVIDCQAVLKRNFGAFQLMFVIGETSQVLPDPGKIPAIAQFGKDVQRLLQPGIGLDISPLRRCDFAKAAQSVGNPPLVVELAGKDQALLEERQRLLHVAQKLLNPSKHPIAIGEAAQVMHLRRQLHLLSGELCSGVQVKLEASEHACAV